jgi:hypothetical protein
MAVVFPSAVLHKPAGGGGSLISSIQYVSVTIAASGTSGTATISSVNTGRTAIFYNGLRTGYTGTDIQQLGVAVTLTNSTTITATCNTGTAAQTKIVELCVVEFSSGVAQYGSITITGGTTSNTATISSVDTSRSAVLYLGFTHSASSTEGTAYPALELTNATTVTGTINTAVAGNTTVNYVVFEFATGVIQSVQKMSVTNNSATTSFTDTISSVSTSNTLLLYNGVNYVNAAISFASMMHHLQLTNSTTVTFTRGASAIVSKTIKYTVLEFVSGVLNSATQQGTIPIGSGSSSATSTITAVTTAKTLVAGTNFACAASGVPNVSHSSLTLTNTTTITGNRVGTTSSSTPAWMVAEFV